MRKNNDNSKYVRSNSITSRLEGIIERTYGPASRDLGVLAGVYMAGAGAGAYVGLLEVPMFCVLKEKRSKHEFDGNIIFVLVLFRFDSFAFR